MQSSVKQRLIFLREYFQESEWHFAKRTGFTNAAFHKWEKEGASDPKPSSLRQISDATGCSYTWLKDGVGEMFPSAIETKATRPESIQSSIPKGSLLAQIQQEIAEIIGIEKNLTTHVGRKTFTNNMINEQVFSLDTVARMLGHTNAKTTIAYYGSVSENRLICELKSK